MIRLVRGEGETNMSVEGGREYGLAEGQTVLTVSRRGEKGGYWT